MMNNYLILLLLGYLCFCVVNPIESSDWNTRSPEILGRYVRDNCTECDVKQESSCMYLEDIDKCVVCCSDVSCCIWIDCVVCWYEQQQVVVIMTQFIIFLLFGFSIIGLIVVYCKICRRARQHTRRRCIVLHEEHDLTTHCSTIEDLQRPPSYNEVVRNAPPYTSCNNAPPLYTSPYNRTSMQEAPPSYPGTPKPQEKPRDSNQPSSPFAAQHM